MRVCGTLYLYTAETKEGSVYNWFHFAEKESSPSRHLGKNPTAFVQVLCGCFGASGFTARSASTLPKQEFDIKTNLFPTGTLQSSPKDPSIKMNKAGHSTAENN